MAVIVLGLLVLVVAGFTAVLGVGWFAVIPALIAIVIVAWGGRTLAAGQTPASAVRKSERVELLGPGGPDDPEASR